jgi:hypothetical protein
MITWKDDYNGWVGKLINIYIAQRADGMLDVTLSMLGGTTRQLCEGSVYDAHEVAELLCASELPDSDL